MRRPVPYESRRQRHISSVLATVYREPSGLERKVIDRLKEVGISFTRDAKITGHPDIFIEPNVCVFVDSRRYHSRPKDKENDALVTRILRGTGRAVVRLYQADIERKDGLDKCIGRIKEALDI